MKAHLSRRYHFSASHRLHTEAYDSAQNLAIFGKCNNPYGHGHNYTVQVTFSGQVDAATGMVCNLAELDAFAQTNLLARFDHTNLNTLDYVLRYTGSSRTLPRLIWSGFMSRRPAITHLTTPARRHQRRA
jgi:6-pyruvoyltetrahydropterin/6-carboxytetrahydropterin synthase